MNTEVPTPNDEKPSLQEMLEALLASGRAHQEAKKKQGKSKSLNPFKETVVSQKVNGAFKIETVDRRMADPRWTVCNRIMLLRKVTCRNCQASHVAPNETMMVKRSHPKHGTIEEAIGVHDGRFDHLPVIIEQHNSSIAYCQNCVNYIQIKILPEKPQSVETKLSTDLDALFAEPRTAETIIEDELDPDELGWEDLDNLKALEDF